MGAPVCKVQCRHCHRENELYPPGISRTTLCEDQCMKWLKHTPECALMLAANRAASGIGVL